MAALMWASWRCRNLWIFDGEEPDVVMLAAGYCKLVQDYEEYASKVFKPSVQQVQGSSVVWKCPPMGCIKANVDAYVPSAGSAGLGVVFRDDKGCLIMTATKKVELSNPECVEAQAVRYALRLTLRFGYINLWVESDAINVINTISSHDGGLSPIHLVYDDIRVDRARFNVCLFSHAKRNCNTVAHLIARDDTGGNAEYIRFTNFPQRSIKACIKAALSCKEAKFEQYEAMSFLREVKFQMN
ncbi:uncharacterized protein LOC110690559 [Chenopodium quinoa]|uniref:uncharacterized protein LOC110690559 n=1 Tax=Chenopodium quinoa TaxID=63459 RepID=UPI000B78D243|nr:uncharacterized protein LOC110690559 [Chenopodium quinoa]